MSCLLLPSWSARPGATCPCRCSRRSRPRCARHDDTIAIGIDAEIDAALPGGVLGAVSLPQKRDHLAELARLQPGVPWERLPFSAKEFVYKTWSPLIVTWLGFEDVAITFDPATRSCTARLLGTSLRIDGERSSSLRGRYAIRGGRALTAIRLARPAGTPPHQGLAVEAAAGAVEA